MHYCFLFVIYFWAGTVKVTRLGNSHKQLFINSDEICVGFHHIDTFSVCYSSQQFWCLWTQRKFFLLNSWGIQGNFWNTQEKNNVTSTCCLRLEWVCPVILPFLKILRFCITLSALFNFANFYLLMFTWIAVTLTSQYFMVLADILFPLLHKKKHKKKTVQEQKDFKNMDNQQQHTA